MEIMQDTELTLVYNGDTLPSDITQQLIDYAVEDLNIPPSYLITKLHYEGLWGSSDTARINNNWAGMTWNSTWSDINTRPSGVIVTRGSARPSIEGGYYIKYESVQDFLIDWSYLIRKGGAYNVANSENFKEAVKGMFKYGGAQYDYATMNITGSKKRFELYYSGMESRRNAINNANNNILDTIDDGDFVSDPDKPIIGVPDVDSIVQDISKIIGDMKDNFSEFEEMFYLAIMTIFKSDVFNYGSSNFTGNKFITMQKVMNKMYKLKPTLDLDMTLSNVISESNGRLDDLQKELDKIDTSKDPANPEDGSNTNNNPLYPTILDGTYITSGYGYRGDIGVPGASEYHWSIDIASGGKNVPIYATQDGTVSMNLWHELSGWRLRIEHSTDEYHSQYQHLQVQSPLEVGTVIKKGDEIGIMGTTGASSGIHLDFAISTNGTFFVEESTIDPEKYLAMTF